jgi:FAD:protein FMN transferase
MRHPSQNAAPQAPDAADPAEPGALPTTTRRLRIALGTWVAIEATRAGGRGERENIGPAPARANPERRAANAAPAGTQSATANFGASTTGLDAINAAYLAISEVDTRMHPTRPGSDLALINSTAPGAPIEVHPDTWRLLQLARRLYDLTDGVFDPCVPTRPGRLGDLEIKPDTPTLICHAPVQLDLGGIAKGYAIDQAIEALIEHGCSSGLVNAGGDVRVFGDRTETILLRRRTAGGAEDIYRPVELNNAALAVSDLDATERPQEHQGYYNHCGETQRRYAAVLAKDATTADALTKCVLLCPAATTERMLREFAAQSLDTG